MCTSKSVRVVRQKGGKEETTSDRKGEMNEA